jgi:hypothetical protein
MVLEPKKKGLGLEALVSLPQLWSRTQDPSMILGRACVMVSRCCSCLGAQNLLTLSISNYDAKDPLESAFVMVCKCCS